MQDLANRIANLEKTAKSWEIVTLNGVKSSGRDNYSYPFDSKYADYDFAILNATTHYYASNYNVSISNGKVFSTSMYSEISGTNTYSKSGNSIVCTGKGGSMSSTIKVLFYK